MTILDQAKELISKPWDGNPETFDSYVAARRAILTAQGSGNIIAAVHEEFNVDMESDSPVLRLRAHEESELKALTQESIDKATEQKKLWEELITTLSKTTSSNLVSLRNAENRERFCQKLEQLALCAADKILLIQDDFYTKIHDYLRKNIEPNFKTSPPVPNENSKLRQEMRTFLEKRQQQGDSPIEESDVSAAFGQGKITAKQFLLLAQSTQEESVRSKITVTDIQQTDTGLSIKLPDNSTLTRDSHAAEKGGVISVYSYRSPRNKPLNKIAATVAAAYAKAAVMQHAPDVDINDSDTVKAALKSKAIAIDVSLNNSHSVKLTPPEALKEALIAQGFNPTDITIRGPENVKPEAITLEAGHTAAPAGAGGPDPDPDPSRRPSLK